MKTPKVNTIVKFGLSMLLAFGLYVAVARPAAAQEGKWLPDDSEIAMVMSDYGWTAVGKNMFAQQITLHFDAPYVGIWVRFAKSNNYGDWAYAHVMINCEDRSSLVYALLDRGRAMTMEAATGESPRYKVQKAGSDNALLNAAVCNLYGY